MLNLHLLTIKTFGYKSSNICFHPLPPVLPLKVLVHLSTPRMYCKSRTVKSLENLVLTARRNKQSVLVSQSLIRTNPQPLSPASLRTLSRKSLASGSSNCASITLLTKAGYADIVNKKALVSKSSSSNPKALKSSSICHSRHIKDANSA